MTEIKTVTSVSGGQSSAYVAANYPSDYLVFALVTTEDQKCKHPDPYLRKLASDKIGREFVGTLEDDVIIETMLELEQWLEQDIDWVVGDTFDEVATNKGGWLPNKLHRYCTVEMKLRPMYRWWKETIGEPVNMQIGFRAGEERRAVRMMERCNEDGLLEFKDVIGKHSNGNNKWATMAWQKPSFPMIEDAIHRDKVVEFWDDIPVPFAQRNNCVGCFHRNPLLLRKMWDKYPNKMEWFAAQERVKGKGQWRHGESSYDDIKKHRLQHELSFEDFSDCDSGHCGL
jgi:hypothetical protein